MNIQQHYRAVEAGSRALAIANKLGQPHRAKAMAAYNRARARLRHAQNGTTPPRRYEPDFMATVNGIPCGVVVTSLIKPERAHATWSREGLVGAEPGYDGDCDFFLVDRNGYRADWLEGKMTDGERDLIGRYIINDWEISKCIA